MEIRLDQLIDRSDWFENIVYRTIAKRAPELHELLKEELVRLQQESHLERSKGHQDAGIKWKPLAESTIEQKKLSVADRVRIRRYSRRPARRRGGMVDRAVSGPEAIGIETGELIESLRGWIEGRKGIGARIVMAYESDHAEFFDAVRKLFPVDMPASWLQRLTRVAYDWLRLVMEQEFGK